MTRPRPRAAVGLVCLAAVVLAGCAAGRLAPGTEGGRGDHGACARISGARQVRGEALCEDAWTCSRPPNGEWDRAGIRRLALCDDAAGPVVLYLPGMHMNAEIAGTDAHADFRLHLALAGHRVWGLDWRPHALAEASVEQARAAVAAWDRGTFVGDAAWAVRFVQGAERAPVVLAGFSYGASIAYDLASRGTPGVEALVILDGAPASGAPVQVTSPVLDLGSERLSWDARQRLLEAVLAAPDGPSPVDQGRPAGRTLAELLWSDPAFGGKGGLSAARNGVSDLRVVARLLASYDRWWPAAALGGAAPAAPSRPLPVLAFASTNLGDAWVQRVRAGARTFGGDQATVRVLPLHGHLDVLVGRLAVEEVYEPLRLWLEGAGTRSRRTSAGSRD